MDKNFIALYNKVSNTSFVLKDKDNLENNVIVGNTEDNMWKYYYDLVKEYHKQYGNIDIPASFKTMNGYEYNESGVELGKWLHNQIISISYQDVCEMSLQRIELLMELGANFKRLRNITWLKNYELAKKYYGYYGNLKIPRNFKTKNGYEFDEKGTCLGRWLETQRQSYRGNGFGKITEEKIKLLKKIDIVFIDLQNKKWLENYELSKKYYNHYGHLHIPRNFKTINGFEYNESGINLGNWISTQRKVYRGICLSKLDEKHIKLLEEIGMVWFSDQTDNKLKNEMINEKNILIKKQEILNRFKSYLNTLNNDEFYSKEYINSGFVKKLSK